MSHPGTEVAPLRLAVVGSGPAGFYVADAALRTPGLAVEVDLFDRLPTPYGLVRYGVAPDHPEVKRVVKVYERTAAHPAFAWFGNVACGDDPRAGLAVDDLRRHYHAVVFSTGAQTDRRLGVPGEDLRGSHPATTFVAWYNGHPDARAADFGLDRDLPDGRAVVIGVGNVAIDVARMLCRHPAELATTDVANDALEALRQSRVREVLLVGRRGPAQAAFTNGELEEVGDLADADVAAIPSEVDLDPLSAAAVAARPDRLLAARLDLLRGYAARAPTAKARRLVFRFLRSPVEILGDDAGRVRAVRLARNVLEAGQDGTLVARTTDDVEEIPCGLVFRAVGYRGVPIPGVPFDERRGVVPNAEGRVIDPASGAPVPGLYVAGWIKRGPSGVIGTNRPDAAETVRAIVADAAAGALPSPAAPTRAAVVARLREQGVRAVTFAQWRHLDALEASRGAATGRPRVKTLTRAEMLAAMDEAPR